jgi:hypothetical protein
MRPEFAAKIKEIQDERAAKAPRKKAPPENLPGGGGS